MLVVGCLCFLCVLGAAKACDSDENKPIRDYCFGELMGDVFACSISALKISRVIGLCCLTMHSSFSLAVIMFEHMFVWSIKLVGALNWRSVNKVLIASK